MQMLFLRSTAAIAVMVIVACSAPPDAVWQGLEGDRKIRLSDYRGRWVFVNYWATWCRPCVEEMPLLSAFHRKYNRRAVVIGVNYEMAATETVRDFIERYDIRFPIVRAQSVGNTTPFGPLRALPVTWVVDPQGLVVAEHLGKVDAQLLESYLRGSP